eukprot:11228358-Lingulodinium_polyedra.AAC.2
MMVWHFEGAFVWRQGRQQLKITTMRWPPKPPSMIPLTHVDLSLLPPSSLHRLPDCLHNSAFWLGHA